MFSNVFILFLFLVIVVVSYLLCFLSELYAIIKAIIKDVPINKNVLKNKVNVIPAITINNITNKIAVCLFVRLIIVLCFKWF